MHSSRSLRDDLLDDLPHPRLQLPFERLFDWVFGLVVRTLFGVVHGLRLVKAVGEMKYFAADLNELVVCSGQAAGDRLNQANRPPQGPFVVPAGNSIRAVPEAV